MPSDRRRVLRLLAGAGASTLAGCSSLDPTTSVPGKLTAQDGDSYDQFGDAVALAGDGTTALIGAPNDENPNGEYAGSAYVFERAGGGWRQQAKLAAPDGDASDHFGFAVALAADGTTALVGAWNDEHPNGEAEWGYAGGSAYLFERTDSWH